ncbi:MAG: DUF5132 domain-containing protein [Desulfobacteraceae bacterium]|jgi:hypothetical protein|nr:MAG: DUF5132 domain-containing protein [Desulfobacteraceae bacterium]
MKLISLPGDIVGGVAIGAAAVILGPVLLPVASGILKSFAKIAIKGGLIAYERGKVAMAEAQEAVEDITAEAKAELSEEETAVSAPRKKRPAASRSRKKAVADVPA